MAIFGSDLPPGVLAERFLDGHHQVLVERAGVRGAVGVRLPGVSGNQAAESEGALPAYTANSHAE